MPLEYRLIRAAKVLGTDVMTLKTKYESSWIDWAFIAEEADDLLQQYAYDNAKSKNGSTSTESKHRPNVHIEDD